MKKKGMNGVPEARLSSCPRRGARLSSPRTHPTTRASLPSARGPCRCGVGWAGHRASAMPSLCMSCSTTPHSPLTSSSTATPLAGRSACCARLQEPPVAPRSRRSSRGRPAPLRALPVNRRRRGGGRRSEASPGVHAMPARAVLRPRVPGRRLAGPQARLRGVGRTSRGAGSGALLVSCPDSRQRLACLPMRVLALAATPMPRLCGHSSNCYLNPLYRADLLRQTSPELAGASSTPLPAKQHPHSQLAPLLALTSAQARTLAAFSPSSQSLTSNTPYLPNIPLC